MVNQIAESIFLEVLDARIQLLGRATVLAIVLGIFRGSHFGVFELGAGNHFIVDARDDFFDDFALGFSDGGGRLLDRHRAVSWARA